MRRVQISNISKELESQELEDVFTEFYRLRFVLRTKSQHTKNYIIIRLVTIVEQFFRKIIENYIRKEMFESRLNITLCVSELDDVYNNKAKKISLGQSIQSANGIKEIMECCKGSNKIDIEYEIDEVKKLFKLRNNIVHTVITKGVDVKENYERVENLIRAVIEQIDHKNEDFYIAQGTAHYNLTMYEKSIDGFDKALEINPDNALAHIKKGHTLVKLNKYDEAIICYNKSLELEPNNLAADTAKKHADKMKGEQKSGK